MAQIIVRNLDESIKMALQERAALRGTSMEAEAREILQRALLRAPAPKGGLGSRMHARFAKLGGVELEPLPASALSPAEMPG